jgi:hypothetical protein
VTAAGVRAQHGEDALAEGQRELADDGSHDYGFKDSAGLSGRLASVTVT